MRRRPREPQGGARGGKGVDCHSLVAPPAAPACMMPALNQEEDRMWKLTALFAALLAVTLVVAGPAPAQSPPAAQAAPEALAAARELIVTMKAADNFKALMPALMN